MKFSNRIIPFIALLFLVACQSDNNIPLNETIAPSNENSDNQFAGNFGSNITRDFLGSVIDTNENPIEGVSITIGSLLATTDNNGVFIIKDATVYERFAYVKASKTGYLNGSRAVMPTTGTNKITIMLLDATVVGTTMSGTPETISLPSGASVSLAGDYINEDGSDYSGSVAVMMHFLDPVDENMPDQMPGMLYAANANNEERMLQTYGMLAVELRGTNGEKLNLAEGTTAELTVPLDASLLADAPSSIPLWYFDEDNGYWKEEGSATLVGNSYVGTVSHFSFWNCDIPAEAINLCVTLTDDNGNPIANSHVNITSDTYGTRNGFTNVDGQVCGLVPSNETLEINAYDYTICGNNIIYTSSIGPYTADSTLDVTIEPSNIISETITGTFNNCDNDPVTNGYVVLTYGNQQFIDIVSDGQFEINIARCDTDNSFSIEALDYDNIQTTGIINYTFSTPSTHLGTLTSCNSVEEFMTYQVDDHPAISYAFNIAAGLDGNYLTISYYDVNNQDYNFNLTIPEFNGINSYTNAIIDFSDANADSTTLEYRFQGIVNITTFGNVDEYLDINLIGNLVNFTDPNNTDPMSGTIHVLRDF